jgi:hypothetical protein
MECVIRKISLACSDSVTENADRSLVATPIRLSLGCEYCSAISVMLIFMDLFQNPDVAESGPVRIEPWADTQLTAADTFLSLSGAR